VSADVSTSAPVARIAVILSSPISHRCIGVLHGEGPAEAAALHLAATGLTRRELYLVPEATDEPYDRLPDSRKEDIVEAGKK
jgi:hypothetical protein